MRKLGMLVSLVLLAGIALAEESHVWDSLRPISDFASGIDLPVKVIVFLLTAGIFAISLLAYFKSKSKRILLVSIAFLFFALKWLVKIIDLFYSPGNFLSDSSESVFELGIIAFLFVAIFYRKSWARFFDRDN